MECVYIVTLEALKSYLISYCSYEEPILIENLAYNIESCLYYAILNKKNLITMVVGNQRIASLCFREYDPKFTDGYASCVLQNIKLSNLDGAASYMTYSDGLYRFYYIDDKFYTPDDYLTRINDLNILISDKLAKELLFDL